MIILLVIVGQIKHCQMCLHATSRSLHFVSIQIVLIIYAVEMWPMCIEEGREKGASINLGRTIISLII